MYERIYYRGTVAPSILRICDRNDAVIVVHSFSKSYCMTGWRLGWCVSRGDLIEKATQLNEFIVSHAPSMVQRAGETALRLGESGIPPMVVALKERVRLCYDALAELPSVSLIEPDGAFYLFPSVGEVSDSFQFALDLLRAEKVSVAPGVAFGRGGEGAIRIYCAADLSVLEPAMAGIRRFLEKR